MLLWICSIVFEINMESQFQVMDISSSSNSNNDQNFDHLNLSNLNSPSSGFTTICCGSGIIGSSIGGGGGGSGNNCNGGGGGCISVGGGSGAGGNISVVSGVTDNFPVTQQLVSTNSFELNVATSLSDDSGVPLTNSSISSGDSYRLGLCKLELELVESDGEVSQFDSLEGSSDGGMSAENFNTLKKGPLAPIDPPPEFQDSPQTTMLRSKLLQNYAINLSEHVIVTALSNWLPPPPPLLSLQDIDCVDIEDDGNDNEDKNDDYVEEEEDDDGGGDGDDDDVDHEHNCLSSPPLNHRRHNNIQKRFLKNNISDINNHYNKHIYASDSLLNKCYNIYDDVDDNLTSSYENSLDMIIINDQKSQLDEELNAKDFKKQINITNAQEEQKDKEKSSQKQQQYQKHIKSLAQQKDHLEIYDYNFYYALKKNYQRENYYQQHKRTPSTVLYSPLHHNSHNNNHRHHHHHHHNHNYNSNGSNIPSLNRPNSRNSLNSRLSSSHNSLTVPNANKADDSIFITQAMSHDALLSREISDFYNVPIGADIYSFPIDMIKPPTSLSPLDHQQQQQSAAITQQPQLIKDHYNNKRDIGNNSSGSNNTKQSSSKGRFKNTRNKKRRRSNNAMNETTGIDKYSGGGGGNKIRPIIITTGGGTAVASSSTTTSKTPHKRHSVPENTITPLQMTLDEVKKFYHSLYSSTSDSNETLSHINLTNLNNNNNNNNYNNNTINNKNGHIKTSMLNNEHNNVISYHHNSGTLLSITTNNINNLISSSSSSSTTTTTTANTCGATTTITSSGVCINNSILSTKSVNLKNLSNEKNKLLNKSTTHNILNKNDADIRNSSNNINSNNNTNSKYMTTTSNLTNQQLKNHHHHNTATTTTSEKKSQFFINLNLKQKFCSIFRFRKNNDARRTNSSIFEPPEYISNNNNTNNMNMNNNRSSSVTIVRDDNNKFSSRALPPLPNKNSLQKSESKNNTYNTKKDDKKSEFNSAIHFASNIEKVKDYGWYWGPISSEAAEKILSNEPDGSFIVRDSSDDHYIFSLSFKLNNCVRHVRIEQDQGTFSFGSYAKFKSQTITEFIEKAVEHSRSGRYLFFLHRRPEHGPMRVQLTNPVSRFKHIQSLQHMCRFVILKAVVRKDLIQNLPLPRRLLDYLSYKHCYSEQIECDSSSQSQSSGDGVV